MSPKSNPARALYLASDLAGWTGLTRQAVAKAGRRGPLKAARVGSRFDISHPSARVWLEDRGVDVDAIDVVSATAPQRRADGSTVRTKPSPEDDVSLQDVQQMTLAELTSRFGTAPDFLRWTRARKELAAAERQELLLARTRGALVTRRTVADLFGYLDALNARLLGETAQTVALRLAGDAYDAQALATVRERLSTGLDATRSEMVRRLRAEDPAAPVHIVTSTAPAKVRVGTRAAAITNAFAEAQAAVADVSADLAACLQKHIAPGDSDPPDAEVHARTIQRVLSQTLERTRLRVLRQAADDEDELDPAPLHNATAPS